MVHVPSRGDGAPRFGPGVEQVPPVGGGTVPADAYRDPDRFEAERVEVLRRSWMIAARSSELPEPGDFVLYEGHGETVVVARLADGTAAGFHNVCQHRGARICDRPSGHAERFTCPWHGWTYDATGDLVAVPERGDFDRGHLDGRRAPAVAVQEWGGWVWINLAGPDAAPDLLDWIGADVAADLGRFRMEDMVLHEKLVHDVPANYKAIVDGFNEVYHVTELHHVDADFTRAARRTSFHLRGPNSMMFVPRADHLERLDADLDHHRWTICHYVVFPNAVFNNNPRHIQLFNPIPLAVDRTRFVCWELVYPDDGRPGYDDYWAATMAHWETLKGVVAEDLFVFGELDATRHSMGYTGNVFSSRECKPTVYHHTMDHMTAGGDPLDPEGWHPAARTTDE